MIEGKCYYRQQGWWTYEFCYKSHVRQFHMDMNTKKITEEFMLGYYNASNRFEARDAGLTLNLLVTSAIATEGLSTRA